MRATLDVPGDAGLPGGPQSGRKVADTAEELDADAARTGSPCEGCAELAAKALSTRAGAPAAAWSTAGESFWSWAPILPCFS